MASLAGSRAPLEEEIATLHAVKARLAEEVRTLGFCCRIHLPAGTDLTASTEGFVIPHRKLVHQPDSSPSMRSGLMSGVWPAQVTYLTASNEDLERRLAIGAREEASGQLVALRSEVRTHLRAMPTP